GRSVQRVQPGSIRRSQYEHQLQRLRRHQQPAEFAAELSVGAAAALLIAQCARPFGSHAADIMARRAAWVRMLSAGNALTMLTADFREIDRILWTIPMR